jgi:hypothetical protein
MERYIRVNGLARKSKVLAFRYGQMEHATKAIGLITRLKARGSFGMLTETLLRESGTMIKQMVMVFTLTLMELSMRATGKMICSMERVKRSGQMVLSMRVNTLKARNTDKDTMCGQTAAHMKANGLIIK